MADLTTYFGGGGLNDNNTPKSDFDAVPPDTYETTIIGAMVETKEKGEGVNVDFAVQNGEHDGRHVFELFWLSHKNPKAADIGQSQLSKLRVAVGIADLRTTDQLIGKSLRIVTVLDKEGYTRIKRFLPLDDDVSGNDGYESRPYAS